MRNHEVIGTSLGTPVQRVYGRIVMIIELGIAAVGLAVGYFGGTKSGQAEVAAVKVKLAAALPKIETGVTSLEAKAKADVLAVVADLKKL